MQLDHIYRMYKFSLKYVYTGKIFKAFQTTTIVVKSAEDLN